VSVMVVPFEILESHFTAFSLSATGARLFVPYSMTEPIAEAIV